MEPEDILKRLDAMAELGLPIAITEFDVKATDKRLQGEMLRDAMIAFFSHPSVTGVTMWGFWDAQHWLTDAPLFYQDWTPKPALAQYEKLVFDDWKTQAEGETDAEGRFRFRAFYGKHKATLTLPDGKTVEKDVEFAPNKTEAAISIP
jgi:hypothetical protein